MTSTPRNFTRTLAAAIILASGANAAGVLDQEQKLLDATVPPLTVGGPNQYRLAQTVTPARDGLLTAVALPYACVSGSLKVSIQTVVAGKPSGKTYSSVSGSATSGLDTFSMLSFLQVVPVTSGFPFAIVLTSDGECQIRQGPASNAYASGSGLSSTQGSSWTNLTTRPDLPFKTYVAAKNTVYVSSTLGNDTYAGTRTQPVRTLDRAFALAVPLYSGRPPFLRLTREPADIAIHAGEYRPAKTLTVYGAMNVIGGHTVQSSSSGWAWSTSDPSAITRILAPWPGTEYSLPVTLAIRDVQVPTVVKRLVLDSTNALIAPGANSNPMWVYNATGELTITSNTIMAGRGGSGQSGMAGMNGTAGQTGGSASKNIGGAAGKSACAAGGAGGTGETDKTNPTNGRDGSGVAGGAGGQFYVNGGVGGAGRAGFSWLKVSPGGLAEGYLLNNMWHAGVGIDGNDGSDGSGGGGGGGARMHMLSQWGLPLWLVPVDGAGGGGGGGGGCAGKGGRGGLGGGASIGIFLYNASPVMTYNNISTMGGGNGGYGGAGGCGGAFGAGGKGAPGYYCPDHGSVAFGGNGGNGGRGGSGSGGAGAAGGMSAPYYAVQGSNPLVMNNLFEIGEPGAGGEGGKGCQGSADGAAGQNGIKVIPPQSAGRIGTLPPTPVYTSQSTSFTASVPAGQSRGDFAVSFEEGEVAVTVVSPSGKVYTADSMEDGVELVMSIGIRGFRIANPEAGTWTVRVEAVKVPESGTVVSAAVVVEQ